jgi:hypothetical protein
VDNPKLLTEDQLAEIRAGVKEGIRGPVMLKWIALLLEDHHERVRLDGAAPTAEGLERAIVGALRAAIHDHGPITAEHLGSAAKRVPGNIANARPGPKT